MKKLIVILLLSIPSITNASTINENLVKIWGKTNANILIKECDNNARISWRHCKILASSIANAESNIWKWAYRHNIFWINNWKKFNSDEESIKDWVKRYNKYWYRLHYFPWDFYKNKWVWVTHYCTSEESSNTKNWCPFWLKNSMLIWNQLKDLK